MSGVVLLVPQRLGRFGLGMRRGLLALLKVPHELLHMLASVEDFKARQPCIEQQSRVHVWWSKDCCMS